MNPETTQFHCKNRSSLRTLRRGMTLLEVMLSLLILLVSIGAISGLITMGLESSAEAQRQTIAQILCEGKMGEIASGVQELTATNGTFPNHPDWTYEIQLGNTSTPGLLQVRVIVRQSVPGEEEFDEFQLVRLKLDPNFEPDTAE